MDLTTRCPHCGTTFAASLEQLQLRKGYIRCVQCAHIFDGYEAVVPAAEPESATKPEQPQSATPPVRPEPIPDPVISAPDHRLSSERSIPSVVRGRREFTISKPSSVDTPSEPYWTISDPDPEAPASQTTAFGHIDIDVDRINLDTDDDFDRDHDPVRINVDPIPEADHIRMGAPEKDAAVHYAEMWREPAKDVPTAWWRSVVTVAWGVVIVAGLVIFAAQLVYVYRVQIAEHVPSLRPALVRMCEALDCSVPYARRIELIVITQSSLQQEPREGDDEGDAALLQFTMRNVHDGPQEWPTLVLELQDFSGALIARRHLSKEDYLPADMVDEPFPANSERMIALPMTLQGLQVNGYQLTAFFP